MTSEEYLRGSYKCTSHSRMGMFTYLHTVFRGKCGITLVINCLNDSHNLGFIFHQFHKQKKDYISTHILHHIYKSVQPKGIKSEQSLETLELNPAVARLAWSHMMCKSSLSTRSNVIYIATKLAQKESKIVLEMKTKPAVPEL